MDQSDSIFPLKCDVLIIGAGILGITTGIALLKAQPHLKIIISEKEHRIGVHASGRNSGVLHAGFYYSPDSLKAKFCREGNKEIRILAKKYSIPVRECGKVVVAKNAQENLYLDLLLERGVNNGVEIYLHDESKLHTFEPLAKTTERFLWSPNTAVTDPTAVIQALRIEFEKMGGSIIFNSKIDLKVSGNEIVDSSRNFEASYYINAGGAHSDRIARGIGVGTDFAMMPFIGFYRATDGKNLPLQRLVYPVPHQLNPFLGVHFTITLEGKVKIGPTAIPVFGREQYSPILGWSFKDFNQTRKAFFNLMTNDFCNMKELIKTELPKYSNRRLVNDASDLVPHAIQVKNWYKHPPGIRAQLVNLKTGKLQQDFIVENFANSTHILNAVSPGWTSALPFGKYVAKKIEI